MLKLKKLLPYSVILLAVPAVSCGNKLPPEPPKPEFTEELAPPKTEDIVLDKIEVSKIPGQRVPPGAMGTPGMWKIGTPKRAKIKTFRNKCGRKKPEAVDCQVLAGLLWNGSEEAYKKSLELEAKLSTAKGKQAEKLQKQKAQAEENFKNYRVEARDALRRLFDMGNRDEATLQMLSVAEMTLGDEDAATKVYEEAVKLTDSKHLNYYKTWLTLQYLKADRNAEALALVNDWDRSDVKDSINQLAAYVAAWTKFRAADYAGALEEITKACELWGNRPGRDAVIEEAVFFMARAGKPLADADTAITQLTGGNPDKRYRFLYFLAQQYQAAGYFEQGSAALKLLASGDVRDPVPINDQMAFRFERATMELMADHPTEAANLLLEAYSLLEPCADKCSPSYKDAVAKSIAQYATLFHTLYATSLDEKYFEPAKTLYEFYINKMDREDKEVVRGYLTRLTDTKENADPKQGKHDAETMAKSLQLKQNVVKACYEARLAFEPELAGNLKITINVNNNGKVEGVDTEPAPGKEGIPFVAACVTERAKNWSFPGRTVPGNTAVVWPVELAPAPAQ